MSDVDLLELGNRNDWSDVANREAVTGVDGKSTCGGLGRSATKGIELGAAASRVCVRSGVQLDRVRAKIEGAADRVEIRGDEDAGPNLRVSQTAQGVADPLRPRGDIEPSLGGNLLATFGDESDLMRLDAKGDLHHFVGTGHFEVQHGAHRQGEAVYVLILDVTAILPEMRGDTIGARVFAKDRGRNRVRLRSAPRLPNRCHVINVDVQAHAAHVL